MNRRYFLERNSAVLEKSVRAVAGQATAAAPQQDPPETISRYANKVLPKGLARTTSTLVPYTGTWGYAQAGHLLRRSLFGPTRTEILVAAGSNLTAVLSTLLTPAATPALPLNVSATDTSVPIGQPWISQPFDQNFEAYGGLRCATGGWACS